MKRTHTDPEGLGSPWGTNGSCKVPAPRNSFLYGFSISEPQRFFFEFSTSRCVTDFTHLYHRGDAWTRVRNSVTHNRNRQSHICERCQRSGTLMHQINWIFVKLWPIPLLHSGSHQHGGTVSSPPISRDESTSDVNVCLHGCPLLNQVKITFLWQS